MKKRMSLMDPNRAYNNGGVLGKCAEDLKFAGGIVITKRKSKPRDDQESDSVSSDQGRVPSHGEAIAETADLLQRTYDEVLKSIEHRLLGLSNHAVAVIHSSTEFENGNLNEIQQTLNNQSAATLQKAKEYLKRRHDRHSQRYPKEVLDWTVYYMEAQELIRMNPDNESVLRWLKNFGWKAPSASLRESYPETTLGDGFDHLSPFTLAKEVFIKLRVLEGEDGDELGPQFTKDNFEDKMQIERKRHEEKMAIAIQSSGLHDQQEDEIKQLLGGLSPSQKGFWGNPAGRWTSFPLTPEHLDTNPEFHPLHFKTPEDALKRFEHQSRELDEFCTNLKKRFQRFPISWSLKELSSLQELYSRSRIVAASSQRGEQFTQWLTERMEQFHERPVQSEDFHEKGDEPFSVEDTESADMEVLVSTYNFLLLLFGQLTRQKPVSQLAAVQFVTSLERFHLTKKRSHFSHLIDAFQFLTTPRGRGTLLDNVRQNGLHPCYEFEDPIFGAHVFMNLAVLDMVRRNPSILGEKRMQPFLKPGSLELDKNLFEDRIPCGNGTRSIHRESSANSSFSEVRDHYRSTIKKSSDLLSGSLSPSFSLDLPLFIDDDPEHGPQPQIDVTVAYGHSPEFHEVEHHQVAFRRTIVDKYQNQSERKPQRKQSEREFLASYGDMAVPNPLRSFDSDSIKQRPQNALEAIERVSTNPKNQGLRTQNRLVALLDMIWANLHRRESFGNRFVGLDLLAEIDSLSSNMPEARVAELMLFHQQKVLRLYDKPGAEDLARTNKITRNNLYARILHQFNLFMEDPYDSIDLLARPPTRSPLRRLLHPIRLHTGRDLELNELPNDVVVSIALSRMGTLIDAFEKTFNLYLERLSELPTRDNEVSPSHVHGAMFRAVATLLSLEVCQLHMMVQHLGRGVNWKKSHMHYNQTKLAVEGNSFDAIRDDFSADLQFDLESDEEGSESVAMVLEGQGLPMPLALLQRLNHYCYSSWGVGDETRRSLTQDELKLVASMNLFVQNTDPTGRDYVRLVREFDRLYVNHGPKFMSPNVFVSNSFEYF
jgi:hypothetical protein